MMKMTTTMITVMRACVRLYAVCRLALPSDPPKPKRSIRGMFFRSPGRRRRTTTTIATMMGVIASVADGRNALILSLIFSGIPCASMCRLPAIVPVKSHDRWKQPVVEVCRVVPVAAIVLLFPAGAYRCYTLTTSAPWSFRESRYPYLGRFQNTPCPCHHRSRPLSTPFRVSSPTQVAALAIKAMPSTIWSAVAMSMVQLVWCLIAGIAAVGSFVALETVTAPDGASYRAIDCFGGAFAESGGSDPATPGDSVCMCNGNKISDVSCRQI